MNTYPCDECNGSGMNGDDECTRIRCVGGQIDDLPGSMTKAYADTINAMRPIAPEVMS